MYKVITLCVYRKCFRFNTGRVIIVVLIYLQITIFPGNDSVRDVSGKLPTCWQPQLEALRERELCSTLCKVRDDTRFNDEMVEESLKESFVCPDCGRQTNSKKQLYRHAAQVLITKIF